MSARRLPDTERSIRGKIIATDLIDEQRKSTEPCFLDDDGPSLGIPAYITRTNARELFELREEETVPEAMARHRREKSPHNAK